MGRLRQAEYRMTIKYARTVRQIERAQPPRTVVKRFRRACAAFQLAPTELLQVGYSTCLS
jgi:hypothetical protein